MSLTLRREGAPVQGAGALQKAATLRNAPERSDTPPPRLGGVACGYSASYLKEMASRTL
jgi:hypothetical protein